MTFVALSVAIDRSLPHFRLDNKHFYRLECSYPWERGSHPWSFRDRGGVFLLVYLHMHAVALTKKTLFLPARGWVSAGLPLPRESLADEFQSASGLSLAVRPIAIRLWHSAGKRGGLEACAILRSEERRVGKEGSSE